MASTLYQEIMAEGEARGRVLGQAQKEKETIDRLLTRKLGSLEPEARERLWNFNDPETLTRWYDEAFAVDVAGARALVERIKRGA
jgi:predicted transposase YdaD